MKIAYWLICDVVIGVGILYNLSYDTVRSYIILAYTYVGLLTNCLNNLVTNICEILRILGHIQFTIILY